MIDLTASCVFCGSTTDLNTVMTVKIDNDSYKVSICDDDEDQATPKAVKECVSKKAAEIEHLKQMAEKYGFVLAEKDLIAPRESEPAATAPARKPAPACTKKASAPILRRQHIEGKEDRTPKAPPPQPKSVDGQMVEGHSSYAVDSKDDTQKQLKVVSHKAQTVETHSRGPITIPTDMRDSEGGHTSIRIVNSGGDRALQDRFRGMAESSKSDSGPDFRHSYGVSDCMACGGTGLSRIDNSKPCPKCKGDGIIKR